MYRQARFYVRSALIYLLAAFTVAEVLLLNQAFGWDGRLGVLQYAFYHLLMVGWATQLIGGVALWMFPPFTRERPRGNETLGWAAYVALNVGLLLRVVGEPMHALQPGALASGLLAISAVLQVAAAWLLVGQLWPRVRQRITPPSEGRRG